MTAHATTDHVPTGFDTLAAAVAHHQDLTLGARYTPEQWDAVNRLHAAFDLDVAQSAAFALVGGQPLLAVVRDPNPGDRSRPDTRIPTIVVACATPTCCAHTHMHDKDGCTDIECDCRIGGTS